MLLIRLDHQHRFLPSPEDQFRTYAKIYCNRIDTSAVLNAAHEKRDEYLYVCSDCCLLFLWLHANAGVLHNYYLIFRAPS